MSSTVAVKAFAEGVTQQIKEHLPDEYRNVKCEVTQQQKNNGSIQIGIIFNIPGRELAPIIYMEPFYDQARSGEPLDKIMDDIVQVSEKALGVQELPKEINPANYDSIKDYLSLQIINTKANQKMLSLIPHKQMEDLSVICRIELPAPDGDGIGSIKVTHEMMRLWDIRPQDVYEKALENSMQKKPPYLMSMEQAMMEVMGAPFQAENLMEREGTDIPEPGMYILSNTDRFNGSTVLAYPGLQEKLETLFPEGYYLLPSSIHEMIIVPKDGNISPKELVAILFRLNRKEAEALDKKVKKSGLSREAYLRHLISGVVPRDAPPPDYYSMMRELHRIGNNLNQIAQKAHTLNVVDVQRYDRDMRMFEDIVKRITEAVILPEPMKNENRRGV